MKSPALYLLEVFFCSGMLLAFYRLLLVRKVSFAACRRYLVAAMLLSAAIPALDIPLYPARTETDPLPLVASQAVPPAEEPFVAEAGQPAAVVRTTAPATDWGRVARIAVAALYLLTVAVSLAILAVRILGIRRLRRRSRITDCGAYAVAENPRVGTPFSFLRTVFLGEGYEGRRREIVVCHEASHVRHRHSAERIALELVCSVFWFNPFVWIAGCWLSEVQEWEADRDVLDAGYGLTEYRTIIFRQLFGYNPDIACGLNHSLTKNRFAMMTQFTKHRFAFVRFGAAIPVVAGMMMLCSFTTKTPAPADPGMTARVHISADGTVTFNGRPISRDELADYVAAERAKLPEADRAGMQVHLTSDGAAMQDRASIRIASDGSILLNGDPVAVAQLEPKLTAWRGDRSPADVCVSISAGKEVKMGVVTDIKQALRAANILRVMYNGTDERMVMRMLPPLSSSSGVKVVVDVVAVVPDNAVAETVREDKPSARPEIRIKERNVFLVLVNGKGKVMAGTAAGQEVVAPRDLTARVEAFVLNASDDPGLSEKVVKQFDLPGGGRMEYPESQGIVSLQTTRDTPFDSYLDIQNRIAQAFDNIRAGLAQRQFGKPYGELSDAERQVVTRAVPLKVSEAEPRMLPGR
nr:biopolymer transporter ExbD [Alistipes onderdonkii]